MHKSFLTVLCLAGVISLGACSGPQTPGGAPQTSDATPAADAGKAPDGRAAVARAEPDYPQPAVVMPPKPKQGAPHGPGFDMPLIELGGYAPPRPMEILRDAHMFAANHPEVASFVPCYCGCGSAGHKNNADCFVLRRNPDGRVAEWEPHGVSCAVCIDIAVDSMRMRNSGASVVDIRKKVQGDYRPNFPNSETPTPAPLTGK